MRGAACLLFLLGGLAFGQTFEAADVHVSSPDATPSGGFLPNGRVEFRAISLLRLISTAWRVPADRVAGGPSWLDTDRFDVTAKAAGNGSQEAMRNMLQKLLAERFELAVKQEEKPLPVYALTVARRGVKESAGTGDPQCQVGQEENLRTLTCRNTTIASLAERLPLSAPQYFNLPLVDRTELKGSYDFKLSFAGRAQIRGLTDADSLFTSIEKQLGIKVENQTAPMPVLTVEHVNRKPAANPPGTDEKLGPPPTEFDAADLKPSRAGANEDFEMTNGRIRAQAIRLRDLIAFAYNVEEDWISGAEKWIDSDRYDLVAKTAPTASGDTLRVMLAALLAERFQLKVHKEPQPVTVFGLTGSKPKMKEADAASRSTCKPGAADGFRTLTCTNTTMAQLAPQIRERAAAYLDKPVVDLTGLTAGYDFTLSWTPAQRLQTKAGSDDAPVGLTIFEAVDRQLGLKLATQKHAMPIVVIDHIVRTPVGN